MLALQYTVQYSTDMLALQYTATIGALGRTSN